MREAVRVETVVLLGEVLAVLRPYATGMMGEVNQNMVELYRRYLRERALLAGAYSHEPVREPVKEVEAEVVEVVDGRVLAAKVLAELERMESE